MTRKEGPLSKVVMQLTHLQVVALYSLVWERFKELDRTREWINVATDEKVTIEELLELLLRFI